MFLVRTITGRGQWPFVLALLLMSNLAWFRINQFFLGMPKPEHQAEAESVNTHVTLPPSATRHNVLQFIKLSSPRDGQAHLIAQKIIGPATVRGVAKTRVCGCKRIEGTGCARTSSEVAKIEVTIRAFFEALRRDDEVAYQCLTSSSFYSFDGGKRFAGRELFQVVRASHGRGVQLNWNMGTIDIHLESNMAWAAWENSGSAGDSMNPTPMRWLESAVLVKNKGIWRIGFLHSTRAAPPGGNSN